MPPHERAVWLAPAHLSLLHGLLRTHVPQAEVWAYGSRVTGQAHEGSDLDLVLRHATDLQQAVDGAVALRLALQDSRLPILVDVHQWAHLPPGFGPQIESAYVVLQRPGGAERA